MKNRLPRERVNKVKRTIPVRRARIVAEINEIEVGQTLPDFLKNREPSVAGIKNADGSVLRHEKPILQEIPRGARFESAKATRSAIKTIARASLPEHKKSMSQAFSFFSDSPLGLYVHVPFCGSACDYCAFYKETPRREHIDAWLRGIEREAELVPLPRPAETFFIGGGTPGVLSARDLERLGNVLLKANSGKMPREWSIELAPSTVHADKLRVLQALGVNRISLGVQSFDAETLTLLGRRHAPKKVLEAYAQIREAGFSNVNMDLIFSVPGEKRSRWQQDLTQAIALAPEHLSAYCLILEEDAPLLKRLSQSAHFDPAEKSPEREAELYLETWERLAQAGYAQYEIANHAKSAENICQHNLNTWRMHEWLGYGPAAASQCFGKRFSNPADLPAWLDALTNGVPARTELVELDAALLFADAVIFGLRLNEGVNLPALAKRFLGMSAIPPALQNLIARLDDEGYLAKTPQAPGTLALNARGRLVADAVAAAVLEAL